MPSTTVATPATTIADLKAQATAGPSREWSIKVSDAAAGSENKIRKAVAALANSKDHAKPLIKLGMGDPTLYGLHTAPPSSISAMHEVLDLAQANGYLPAVGGEKALQAVADYHKKWDGVEYSTEDIVLTHGTAHALDMVFHVLGRSGSNVVVPRPGFPLYETLIKSNPSIEIRYYDCMPDKEWECNLEQMEAAMDENTAFVVVTNPSNPCGVSYRFQHVRDLVDLADKKKVPIVADEIYGHMVWGKEPFTPFASVSATVPILTLSSLSKRFLLPGWRLGWVALHDPLNVAGDVRTGLHSWGNRVLGPCSLVQGALPKILGETSDEWYATVNGKLEANANAMYPILSQIPGLYCTAPNAAMYFLVGIDTKHYPEFPSDVEFCGALVKEQNFFCVPGTNFSVKNHFRLVIAAPLDVMMESCARIKEFCEKHYVA